MSAEPAPHGPLLGSELDWAIELLTDKQLRAYSYFREGQHTMGWIARRMGSSRQAVMQLVVKAEKRLGYQPSFTPKQKTKPPYKSVAQREAEAEEARFRDAAESLAQLPPAERRRVIRRVESELSSEAGLRRLRKRLKQLGRERRHPEWEDDLETAGDFTAALEADFPGMRPEDFVRDWGRD